MTVTEEEAKTKTCPRTIGKKLWAHGELEMTWGGPQRCIASQCMAWRVIGAERTYAGLDAESDMAKLGWKRSTETAEYGYYYDRPERGYCGLAGSP